MKEVKHNGNHFLIYDSIQELPCERFFQFNLQLALEAGIGGDINAIMARTGEMREWVRRGKKEEALQALNNLENAFNLLIQGVTPDTNAFVCLVKEANGTPVDDLSQSGMTRYLSQWSKRGLTIGKVKAIVMELKKNFVFEVETFFPDENGSTGAKAVERVNLLKRRTLTALRLIQGKVEPSELERFDTLILEFLKPTIYSGPQGFEVRKINAFEDAIVIIRKELNIQGAMTAHQFLKHSETVKAIIAARKQKK